MSPDPRIIARGGRDVGPMPYVRAGFGEPYFADGAIDCRQILFDSTRAAPLRTGLGCWRLAATDALPAPRRCPSAVEPTRARHQEPPRPAGGTVPRRTWESQPSRMTFGLRPHAFPGCRGPLDGGDDLV